MFIIFILEIHSAVNCTTLKSPSGTWRVSHDNSVSCTSKTVKKRLDFGLQQKMTTPSQTNKEQCLIPSSQVEKRKLFISEEGKMGKHSI